MQIKKVKMSPNPKIKIDSKFISAMTINGVEYDVVKAEADGSKCDQCDMEKLGMGQCLFYRILRENAQCPLVYNGICNKWILKRRECKNAD